MKKLAITLTATVLMLATTPLMAYAQSQGADAASVHALAQNAPPIVNKWHAMDDGVHFADRDGSESVGQGLSRPAGALAAVEGCDPRTAMIASRPPSGGRMTGWAGPPEISYGLNTL